MAEIADSSGKRRPFKLYTFYNPATKKTDSKKFSTNTWSLLDCHKKGLEWMKAQMEKNKEFVHENGKRYNPHAKTLKKIEALEEEIAKLEIEVKAEVKADTKEEMPTDTKARGIAEYVPPELDESTGNSFAMFGSSKSGKTTFIVKHLYPLFFKGKGFVSVLFTASLHAKVYDELPDDVVKEDVFRCAQIKDAYRINHETGNKYKFVFILDDIVDQKEDETIKKCFTVYRNSGISTVLSLQDAILMKRTNRGNVNYSYFFRLNNDELVEHVVKMFLSGYLPGKTKDEKVEAYKRLTADHAFLFLDAVNGTVTHGRLEL